MFVKSWGVNQVIIALSSAVFDLNLPLLDGISQQHFLAEITMGGTFWILSVIVLTTWLKLELKRWTKFIPSPPCHQTFGILQPFLIYRTRSQLSSYFSPFLWYRRWNFHFGYNRGGSLSLFLWCLRSLIPCPSWSCWIPMLRKINEDMLLTALDTSWRVVAAVFVTDLLASVTLWHVGLGLLLLNFNKQLLVLVCVLHFYQE